MRGCARKPYTAWVAEKFALARPGDSFPVISPRHYFEVFQYGARALALVFRSHRAIASSLLVLSVVAGLLPALITYTGKLIVDAVVHSSSSGVSATPALTYLAYEFGL